jgi:predicted deacylase
MKKPSRNYIKMLNEFINVQSPFDCEIVGSIIYNEIGYPFIAFHTHSKLAKYNVVINSGAHGTESIGVRVLLRFLQEFNPALLGYYNFLLFPILNPYGYTYGIRKNGNNQYANNGFNQVFEKDVTPESLLVRETTPQKVDLFIDFHSDNKSGFYIYERKRPDKRSLAEKSLKILKKNNIPILEADTVYQEKCINGVIVQPIKDGSMDDSMFQRGAVYSLCIETSSKISEDQQIIGGLLLLNEILSQFKEMK